MPTVQVRAQRVKAAKAERRSIQSKLQSLKAQIAEARPEVDKLAGVHYCHTAASEPCPHLRKLEGSTNTIDAITLRHNV